MGETLTVLAYAVVWSIVTGYLVLISRRMAKLGREIRELRAQVSPPPPSQPSPEARP